MKKSTNILFIIAVENSNFLAQKRHKNFVLILPFIILKNDQTYFKNLPVWAPQDFWSRFGHFSTLWKERIKLLQNDYFPIKVSKNLYKTFHEGLHGIYIKKLSFIKKNSTKICTLLFHLYCEQSNLFNAWVEGDF